MPISYVCPGCGAESIVPDAAAGRVINCAGCGMAVELGVGSDFPVLDAEPVAEKVRLRPAVVEEAATDAGEDRPRPKKRPEPARRRGVPGWVWAGLLVGLVLIGGGATVYYFGDFRQPGPTPDGVESTRPGAEPVWTTFSPPGTPLSVELPGTPTAGEKQPVPVSAGRLERTSYTLTVPGEGSRSQTFEVTVFTHVGIPVWAQGGKGSITEYVAGRDAGSLGNADPVTIDGRKAFRYTREQDGAGEVRVYFGDGRTTTYKVALTGERFSPDHPTVRRVLDSIRYR